MPCVWMIIISHANVKKKASGFQSLHFYVSFSYDVVAVKGLNTARSQCEPQNFFRGWLSMSLVVKPCQQYAVNVYTYVCFPHSESHFDLLTAVCLFAVMWMLVVLYLNTRIPLMTGRMGTGPASYGPGYHRHAQN